MEETDRSPPKNPQTLGVGRDILHFIQESLPNFNLANCNTEDLSAISCAQLCLDIIRKLITLGVIENSENTKSGVSFLGKEMGTQNVQSHVTV